MRLFIGLDLPTGVVGRLERLIETLRPAARIQWSPAANLHITTKFIGEWPETRLEDLKSALAGMPASPPLAIHIHEVGFFPNPRSPRVFWCGVEAPGLDALAAATDRATLALGVPGRDAALLGPPDPGADQGPPAQPSIRYSSASPPCLRAISGGSRRSASSSTGAVCGPSGSVYTKLAEFPLSK